jgi:hypothetical protein
MASSSIVPSTCHRALDCPNVKDQECAAGDSQPSALYALSVEQPGDCATEDPKSNRQHQRLLKINTPDPVHV